MKALQSPRKAEPMERLVVRLRCLPHQGPDQVIGDKMQIDLFAHDVLALAPQNITTSLATGNPQPFFCPVGCPKAVCNSGVSGIEPLDPSTTQTRRPHQRQPSPTFACRASPTFRRPY
jgi:hypothetical protein